MKPVFKLVILLLIPFCTMQCSRLSEQTLYLIPNRFTGTIVVAFDQLNSTELEYRNGVRIFRIPANGILRTKFKANYGFHKPDVYFYVNPKGKIVKHLNYFQTAKEALSQTQGTDTICLNALAFKKNDNKNHYLSMIVGTPANIDSLDEQQHKIIMQIK